MALVLEPFTPSTVAKKNVCVFEGFSHLLKIFTFHPKGVLRFNFFLGVNEQPIASI